MKDISDDLDFLTTTSLMPDDKEPSEFFFDDEPLECILYGVAGNGPSLANLFGPANKCIDDIINACNRGEVATVIALASRLGGTDCAISRGMCYRLAAAISSFFPYYPNPVMEYDLRPLEALFKKMWTIALESKDTRFQDTVGTPVFRWYEHHGRYDEARRILGRLIESRREQGDRANEAIYLNNLGFEYMLEKRWKEALPYFEEAARMFKEVNIPFEEMNARANYCLCMIELDDLVDIEFIEAEAKEIRPHFNGVGRWFERKPLILMAKIEEKRGNTAKAISLVEKAIKSARDSGTRYPGLDWEYLEYLRKIKLDKDR